MARIAGVDLPRNKRIEIALQYIYGIGKTRAKEIVAKTGFPTTLRTDALTDEQVAKLRAVIESGLKVEGDLRREVGLSIKRLMDLAAIVVFVTKKVCRPVVSVRARMRALAKARVRRSRTRRKPFNTAL